MQRYTQTTDRMFWLMKLDVTKMVYNRKGKGKQSQFGDDLSLNGIRPWHPEL